MKSLVISVTLTVTVYFHQVAYAQPSQGTWPTEEPARPLSFHGDWRRDQAAREFYEALGASYRVSAEYNRNEVSALRRTAREAREQSRREHTERARLRNLDRQQAKKEQVARDANELAAAIRSGTVKWPKLLQNGLSQHLADEAVNLLAGPEPLRVEDQHRLGTIARQFKDTVRNKQIDYSHADRVAAWRTATLIEYLGEVSNPSFLVHQDTLLGGATAKDRK